MKNLELWTDTVEERFNSFVPDLPDDVCWEWQGATIPNGYGQLTVGHNGKYPVVEYAHRLSYYFHCGDVPKGMQINHHCDNRPCVNPKHLFLGNAKLNTWDMILKGRYVGRSKLTPEQMQRIGEMAAQGQPANVIARELNLDKCTVRSFAMGKTYDKPMTTLVEREYFTAMPKPYGHQWKNSKLKPDDVRFIREVYKNKAHPQYMTVTQLAAKYGCDIAIISKVARGVEGRYRELADIPLNEAAQPRRGAGGGDDGTTD